MVEHPMYLFPLLLKRVSVELLDFDYFGVGLSRLLEDVFEPALRFAVGKEISDD
jgi:hypothetical protein